MNQTATIHSETVFATISKVIVENAGVPAEKITLDSTFQGLGLDSLDSLAMISDLEEAYKIKIPNQELLQIKTVRQAVESLTKRMK